MPSLLLYRLGKADRLKAGISAAITKTATDVVQEEADHGAEPARQLGRP